MQKGMKSFFYKFESVVLLMLLQQSSVIKLFGFCSPLLLTDIVSRSVYTQTSMRKLLLKFVGGKKTLCTRSVI